MDNIDCEDFDEPFGCNSLIAFECSETYCCWSTTVMYSFFVIFVAVVFIGLVFAVVYNCCLIDVMNRKVPPDDEEEPAEEDSPQKVEKPVKSLYPLLSDHMRKNLEGADNESVPENNEGKGLWETFDWSLVQRKKTD